MSEARVNSGKARGWSSKSVTAVGNWQRAIKRLVDSGELADILVVTTGLKAIDLRRGAKRLPGRKDRLARTSYYFTPVPFREFRRVCGGTLGSGTLSAYLVSRGSPLACAEIVREGAIPEHVIETIDGREARSSQPSRPAAP